MVPAPPTAAPAASIASAEKATAPLTSTSAAAASAFAFPLPSAAAVWPPPGPEQSVQMQQQQLVQQLQQLQQQPMPASQLATPLQGGTGPPTEWFYLAKSQSQKSARIISVAEVPVCCNLELLACETCRGHIRRARDRPNPPKGA